jgi:hypothetical protein
MIAGPVVLAEMILDLSSRLNVLRRQRGCAVMVQDLGLALAAQQGAERSASGAADQNNQQQICTDTAGADPIGDAAEMMAASPTLYHAWTKFGIGLAQAQNDRWFWRVEFGL